MNNRSYGAFFLSMLLHGSMVAVALLFAYTASDRVKPPSKILELVAGEGDNFAARTAPALGIPKGIKVNVPLAPAPKPAPEAVVEPAPAEPTPVTIVPEPIAPKAPPQKKALPPPKPITATDGEKPPDFVKDVKRIAAKRAARLEAQDRKQAEADRIRRLKAEQATAAAAQAQAKITRIDTEGVRKGVTGGATETKTGARGKALTREESSLVDAYFALLKARLKENHEKPPGLSDTLTATVAFFVAADGRISRVSITKSSRNAEFDRSVLDAIRKTESVGVRPDGKGDEVHLEFKMRDEDMG